MPTTTTDKSWTPTVRGPYRVLAGVLAVLGVLGMIGWGFGAVHEWSLELLVPLAMLIPFTALMAQLARRGTVSIPLSTTTVTVSDPPRDG